MKRLEKPILGLLCCYILLNFVCFLIIFVTFTNHVLNNILQENYYPGTIFIVKRIQMHAVVK